MFKGFQFTSGEFKTKSLLKVVLCCIVVLCFLFGFLPSEPMSIFQFLLDQSLMISSFIFCSLKGRETVISFSFFLFAGWICDFEIKKKKKINDEYVTSTTLRHRFILCIQNNFCFNCFFVICEVIVLWNFSILMRQMQDLLWLELHKGAWWRSDSDLGEFGFWFAQGAQWWEASAWGLKREKKVRS